MRLMYTVGLPPRLLGLGEMKDEHSWNHLHGDMFICDVIFIFTGPGFRPPLGLREYAPGVPPGKRDVPFDPRGFVPGHPHFRPGGSPGPREYFAPGPRLPPPSHGPPEYPSPAARDSLPPGSREEPPPASQSGSQGSSQTLKQSP